MWRTYGQLSQRIMQPTDYQHIITGLAKGGLLAAKRRSFITQKVAFYTAKGHLLEKQRLNKTPHMTANRIFRRIVRQDKRHPGNEKKSSFLSFFFCITLGLHYLYIR